MMQYELFNIPVFSIAGLMHQRFKAKKRVKNGKDIILRHEVRNLQLSTELR